MLETNRRIERLLKKDSITQKTKGKIQRKMTQLELRLNKLRRILEKPVQGEK
jgi:hypothetical protein